jgi:hypothetical protein
MLAASGRVLKDVTLIALAWALLVGVIVYPVAQLIGLLTCGVALAIGPRSRVVAAED